MNGEMRLSAIDRSTPAMARALPDLPMRETVMVRVLRLCLSSVGDFFSAEFRKIGISEHAFHVLCLLVATDDGRASPSELSDLVGTSRANMTRILASIVDEGFATRRTEDLDGRRQTIEITEAGRKAALATVPQLVRPLNLAFSGLDASELATLDKLLRKCVKSFDNNALRYGSGGK